MSENIWMPIASPKQKYLINNKSRLLCAGGLRKFFNCTVLVGDVFVIKDGSFSDDVVKGLFFLTECKEAAEEKYNS